MEARTPAACGVDHLITPDYPTVLIPFSPTAIPHLMVLYEVLCGNISVIIKRYPGSTAIKQTRVMQRGDKRSRR